MILLGNTEFEKKRLSGVNANNNCKFSPKILRHLIDMHHYIKILLSEHDRVVIPGLGAFVAHYRPAVLAENYSTVPSSELHFDRQQTQHDGLLISAIVEESGSEYAEAKQLIQDFVTEIEACLEKGEAYRLSELGTLKLNEAGFVVFEPETSSVTLLDAYGLQAISLEKIEAATPAVASKPEPNRGKRRIVPILLFIIAVLASLCVCLFFYKKEVNFVPKTVRTPLADSVSTASLFTTDSKKPDSGLALQQDTTFDDNISSNAEDTIVVSSVIIPTRVYHVIVASLATKRQGEEYIRQFSQESDFKDVILVQGNGRYRVSAIRFEHLQEAISFSETLRLQDEKFAEAWVWRQTKGVK